jgi:hypothetical protein
MILSVRRVGHAWQAGWDNLGRGLAITRRQPDLYLELSFVYAVPPLLAAWLVVFGPQESAWYQPLVFSLPWITVVVAPVVLMQAVAATSEGERLSIFEATRRGVPSVPIYVWTNLHTAALFWIPVGSLVLLREYSPLGRLVPDAGWLALIGVVAVHQHVRTVLAPYLAVHAEFSGTHAAVTSWRLGGTYFWRLLGTFAVGSAAVALPLGLAFLLLARFGPDALSRGLLAASLQLGWVAIQSIRPVLVPALHSVYEEIWADSAPHSSWR